MSSPINRLSKVHRAWCRREILIAVMAGCTAVGSLKAANLQVEASEMQLQVFAEAPLIGRPLAIATDALGRALLLEQQIDASKGPQLVLLQDEDNDGKADRKDLLCSTLQGARSLALGQEDWIYVMKGDELVRLRDADGNGEAETVEQGLVKLEGVQADDGWGLSGIASAGQGWLVFGLNGGRTEGVKLRGIDGWVEDAGTDGSVWRVRADGRGLRRLAGGLARVGGIAAVSVDQVYVSDQDEGRLRPARLVQVVQDGFYGFRKAYAGIRNHPFFGWNGERLGMLPPLSEVGDEPGGMLVYGTNAPTQEAWMGLKEEWQGSVLVACAGEHRVEALLPQSITGRALPAMRRRHLLQGGRDFRPVSLAVGSNGALWVVDQMAGSEAGRVWMVRRSQPGPRPSAMPKDEPLKTLRETISEGPAPASETMVEWLSQDDPVVFHLAVRRLARDGRLARELASGPFQPHPQVRAGVLMAGRLGSENEGVSLDRVAREIDHCLLAALMDASPQVALPALQWVAEARQQRFQSLLDSVLRGEEASLDVLIAAAIAKEETRDGGGPVAEAEPLARLLEDRLRDRELKLEVRLKLLQARNHVSRGEPDMETIRSLLSEFLQPVEGDPEEQKTIAISREPGQVWLTHFVGRLSHPEKVALLREVVFNTALPSSVRAAALSHYPAVDADVTTLIELAENASGGLRSAALSALAGLRLTLEQQQTLQEMLNEPMGMVAQRVLGRPHHPPGRPQAADPAAWARYLRSLPGAPDAGHGRDVFLSARKGNCATCHLSEGLGRLGGVPINSERTANIPSVLAALLRPSATLSPQAKLYKVSTVQGQERLLCLIERGTATSSYLDGKGEVVELRAADLDRREPIPASIMPEGLLKGLTDEEVRDLLAYLMLPNRQ